MTKSYDKYRLPKKESVVKSYDKYRVKTPVGDPHAIMPDLYLSDVQTNDDGSYKLVPYEEIEKIWKLRNNDPKTMKENLDETTYYNKRTGNEGKAFVKHEPTWLDRGKELGQGLAAGVGGLADIASNYVAAPITGMAAMSARGQGKLFNFVGAENAAKMSNKIADDLQLLSNKYGNQNSAEEFKKAKVLKTKNTDNTSYMLKGAGEFIPDMIPANLLGKGVKMAAVGSKVAGPAVKGFRNKAVQWFKDPKLPKLANLLETPMTGRTAAAFAGAGAGHGIAEKEFHHNDGHADLIADLPLIMAGSGIGGGLYGAGRGATKGIYNFATGNKPLPKSYKKLAEKINSGNNALDEEFINTANNSNAKLNAFNIYKDNKVPFNIAKYNPTKEYHDILPNMKHDIYDETNKILDNSFVKYDKNNPRSEISHTSDLLRLQLEKAYTNAQNKATAKYTLAKEAMSPDDYIVPNKIILKANELVKDSDALSHGTSSSGELNRFVKKLVKEIPEDGKIPLHIIHNQRRAINGVMSGKTDGKFNLTKDQRDRLQELKHAIDDDLYGAAYDTKTIKDRNWMRNFKDADLHFSENVMPFRDSKMFKNFVNKGYYKKDQIGRVLRDTKSQGELNQLLELMGNQSIIRNKKNKLVSKPYTEAEKNMAWLKRLETAVDLFDGKGKDKFSISKLGNAIINSAGENPLYKHSYGKLGNKKTVVNASKELRENVKPTIQKYEDLLLKDIHYKSGLNNKFVNPEYYYSKYDVKKHIPHWPTIAGGAIGSGLGSIIGPVGYGLGAAGGALVGGLIKQSKSAKIMKTMTDKQFVDELIRIGRLPKTERDNLLTRLVKRPVLKTEIIKMLFKNNKNENNK